MRKNISLLSLEFLDSPFDITGNLDSLTQNVSAVQSAADVTILSFLPPSSPWVGACQEIAQKFPAKETSIDKRSPSPVLALVRSIANTGRLALAADKLHLSGSVVFVVKDGFYLTSFMHHQLETQYFHWEDLALSPTLSAHEIQILSLAWILYSGEKCPSMLEAIDIARKIIRCLHSNIR